MGASERGCVRYADVLAVAMDGMSRSREWKEDVSWDVREKEE